jgi:basic membrane protein A and related proteins
VKNKHWLRVAMLCAAFVTLAALLAGTGMASSSATIKAGLVSDVGRFNDRSFNQSALEGMKRAASVLGIKYKAVESKSSSDYIPNLESLARAKYNIIISVGFLLAGDTHTVAQKYPDRRFAIVDYSVHADPFTGDKNVDGLTFNTNENSYLIGCLAAYKAKQKGKKIISAVGGLNIPTVSIFIAGYRAGAKKCVKGTKTLINFSQTFNDQSKCKELALNQIAAGSQVVFQVAGGCGLGALSAAKSKGKWGIGVDKDQSNLGSFILTSAVKRVDQSVFLTVKAVKEGKFRGGRDLVFNLKNKGVGLGKLSPKCKCATFIKKRINPLKALIIKGKIRPPKKL